MKAENDSPNPDTVFPGWEKCPYVILHIVFFYSFILYVYRQLCTHNGQNKVRDNCLVFFTLLCCSHMMQGFVYEKMLQGSYNYPQDRRFSLTGNEENPAFVCTFKHIQNNISPIRLSVVRLYRPLHVCYHPASKE